MKAEIAIKIHFLQAVTSRNETKLVKIRPKSYQMLQKRKFTFRIENPSNILLQSKNHAHFCSFL